GLALTPLRLAAVLFNDFLPIYRDGAWEMLTTPGAEAYHYLWAPLLIFELVGNVFLIGFALVLLLLYFAKFHRFPILIIAFLVLNVSILVADLLLVALIPVAAADDDLMASCVAELLKMVVAAGIWIPYFLVSRRVKNTFVKPLSASFMN
ncbi:MAG: DUF2569 domain-containing protein, partial [Planctomycetota bacterium]